MSGADPDVLLVLPDGRRHRFKEPMGRVFTDPEALLERVDGPLVTVGDVVTFHVVSAGRRPDVAVIDGITKRGTVDDAITDRLESVDARRVRVDNPPASLTGSMLSALRDAVEADAPTVVEVDGEEDLVTIPAVIVAPIGASVVYGQPDVGMVHVPVDETTRATARELLSLLDGDVDRALEILAG